MVNLVQTTMADHVDSLSTASVGEREFLAIDTPFGDDEVVLTEVEGEDALSRCFLYRATVTTDTHGAEMETLVGKPVTLWLSDGNAGHQRPVSGHVRRVRSRGRTRRGSLRFELEIVPRLWFLSCTSDCRIFQHLSVPDIIREMFDEHGLQNYQFRIAEQDFQKLDYCVQYRESALDFISRLLEHLGLFYWHEHAADRHILIIAASNLFTDRVEPYTVKVLPDSAWGHLTSLETETAFRPGKWTLNDYDFQSPTRRLVVEMPTVLDVPRMADHEIYEYPGQFNDPDDGRQLTRLRIEMEEAQHRRVSGAGHVVTFDPGRRFEVADHDGQDGAQAYLLTALRHRASWAGRETGDVNVTTEYENEFTAIPASVMFRPERVTPKPFVRGVQTATIVGPAGENIFCDEYGRVKVQFHWDRRGRRNAESSCWLRVAQARSGAHYGTFVVPHVGHEVLVEFIEGDPDRPLITGTVPNAMTMPPVPLPRDKNKTVQRDHGDNKIVMQGQAGQEYLSMSSPRAVNMFAVARHARPLSASAVHVFPYDPTDDPSSGTAMIPTKGSVVSIPAFQDSNGLDELYQNWFGVILQDSNTNDGQSGNSTTTGSSSSSTKYPNNQTNSLTADASDPGSGNDSFINSGSEGRANFLSLGNNNSWVNADSNSWVNGSVNVQVNQSSYTTIGGYDFGASNGNATSSLEVYGTNKTIVHGENLTEAETNITIVSRDNTQVVAGANEALTVGNNDAVNLGVNVQVNVGGNLALNLPFNVQMNIGGENMAYNSGNNMQLNTGINLSVNSGLTLSYNLGSEIKIKDDTDITINVISLSSGQIELTSHKSKITQSLMHLFM